MADIEYSWSMGNYEYIHWTGTVEEWEKETAESLTALGQQWYAAKTCVLHGRDNPEPLPAEKVQKLIETELGGKVIEVTENQPEKKSKPWDKPIDVPTPEWEHPKTAPAKPATKGFEDF